ncbi:hypothetical protein ABK040_016717 [Willaertia magna]
MTNWKDELWLALKYKKEDQLLELLKNNKNDNTFNILTDNFPDTNRPLPLEACSFGLFSVVHYIFNDLNVNVNFQQTTTLVAPVHMASREGHVNIVKYLVDKGANINLTDRERYAAIHYAVGSGQINVVKVLVEIPNIQVNEKDFLFRTPLMRAVESCNFEIIKLLIERGHANVNLQNNTTGWTALHYASYGGFTEICQYLLKKGADSGIKDKENHTALYYGYGQFDD